MELRSCSVGMCYKGRLNFLETKEQIREENRARDGERIVLGGERRAAVS